VLFSLLVVRGVEKFRKSRHVLEARIIEPKSRAE